MEKKLKSVKVCNLCGFKCRKGLQMVRHMQEHHSQEFYDDVETFTIKNTTAYDKKGNTFVLTKSHVMETPLIKKSVDKSSYVYTPSIRTYKYHVSNNPYALTDGWCCSDK